MTHAISGLRRHLIETAAHAAIEALESRRLLATFTVTTAADSGAGSLRDAIAHANAAAGADVVDFAIGSSTINLTSGEISISDELTVDGPAGGGVTISAGGLSRIFNINTVPATGGVEINDLTLTSADANGGDTGPSALEDGGAVLSTMGGTLTLRQMTISNSLAADGGAAAVSGPFVSVGVTYANNVANDPDTFNSSASGGALILFGETASISGGAFNDNRAGLLSPLGNRRGIGGAVYAAGALSLDSVSFSGNIADSGGVGGAVRAFGDLSVNNSTFANNIANDASSDGGAIYTSAGGTIAGSTFTGNTAESGAGIRSDGPLTLTGDTFTDNDATTNGGAVYANSDVAVLNSSFTDNDALNQAGAMVVTSLNSTITGSSFTNNTSGATGGAIVVNFTPDAFLELVDTTFTGNAAGGFGGGFYSFHPVSVTDSSFSGNSAASSGGALGVQGANLDVAGSNFDGNSSQSRGGAIRHSSAAAPVRSIDSGILAEGEEAAEDSKEFSVGGRELIFSDTGVVELAGQRRRAGPGRIAGADMNIFDSVFTNNTAVTLGGAVQTFGGDGDTGVYHIYNSRFVGNTAEGSSPNGGGLFADGATLLIENSEFSDNTAVRTDPAVSDALGGAIATQNLNDFRVLNSTFAGNAADRGGAIWSPLFGEDGDFTIVNSTITDNTATVGAAGFGGASNLLGNGGGISLNPNGVDLAESTLNFSVYNSVISGNTDLDGGELPDIEFADNPTGAPATNIVFGGNTTNVFGTILAAEGGSTANLTTDNPLLQPLGFYFNQDTRSMLPFQASPAYNSGTNADAVNPGFDTTVGTADDMPLTVDQNFLPRIVYGQVDIGAAEFAIPGDANLDGTVNLSDFVILRNNFNSTTAMFTTGDFNGDGRVDLQDFVILRNNFNRTIF